MHSSDDLSDWATRYSAPLARNSDELTTGKNDEISRLRSTITRLESTNAQLQRALAKLAAVLASLNTPPESQGSSVPEKAEPEDFADELERIANHPEARRAAARESEL